MTEPCSLKPCPFCGEQPSIIDREVPNDGSLTPDAWTVSFASYEGKSIACVNKQCGMQPATHPCPPESLYIFGLNWNQRAGTPPRAQMEVELKKRMAEAVVMLQDMIDGGDECRGMDSQISAVINKLEGLR